MYVKSLSARTDCNQCLYISIKVYVITVDLHPCVTDGIALNAPGVICMIFINNCNHVFYVKPKLHIACDPQLAWNKMGMDITK